jgi:hypothetical protein
MDRVINLLVPGKVENFSTVRGTVSFPRKIFWEESEKKNHNLVVV